jgi:hypothetical protein
MVRVEKGIVRQEREELKESNLGGGRGMWLRLEFWSYGREMKKC